MSPPRAWEFLIGGLVATPGFPVLRNALAQQIARGHRAGAARDPDIFAAAGAGISRHQRAARRASARHSSSGAASACRRKSEAALRRSRRSGSSARFPIRCISGTGRCSPSRGSPKAAWCSILSTRLALFALTVAISYLSWRFVEQPFRREIAGADAPRRVSHRRLRHGGAARRQRRRNGRRAGLRRIPTAPRCSSNPTTPTIISRYIVPAFALRLPSGVLGDACLALAPGKTNVLLWGDSLAAHYFHGLARYNRSASREYPAGDAGGLHADLQRGRARQCIMPRLCRADGRLLSRPQARPRHPLGGLAGICPSAALRRHDRRSQADDCAAQCDRASPWCCSALPCSSRAGCRRC